MHLMILCPVWLLLGTFPASAWSWTKDGFVDSVLAEYGAYDQAARADTVKDGIITESEFMTSLYRQADVHGNNDNKVSRDEFIDYYGQRFNISSELGTVMFDILNDANSRDEFITSADVSISSFSGKNYATVAEFRDGLEKWLRQSADKLYHILMSPHVLDTKRKPEIKYSVIINSMDANNNDVISTEELNEELKRMNSNQPVRRRDWVWRNTQRYGTDPVTANLVFDYWDRDRDYQLTPRDLQYLADDMDLNGDSKVDHDEFVRFVERGYQLSKRMTAKPLTVTMVQCPDPWWDSLGWSPNVDAHRAAMDFDDDLNGWVTLADLRRWLDVFDDDDDKSISRREYTKYHTERYGVNSTVASAMFDLSDINGDDKLNEQDWEFHFRDGFSVSFCDARRSILDLTRMAEQFRGVRQGRELRESMQRRLQEEWSWYLQNKQQEPSSSRYMADAYDRDSNSRQQDLCGSRTTCYVGEYTEVWGQPEAWLWWGIKTGFGKPEVLQAPFVGTDGGLPRPPMGFPSPVNDVPNQMNRFIGQGSQGGRDPRPPSGLRGPGLGGPGPMFDQPPWLGILSMEPIGGVAPFPRFRRAIDNGGNKSDKSENSQYFSTYHRLRSPFSEAAAEPSTPPVLADQQPVPEQRHVTDKQHSEPVDSPKVDETASSNLESSRIRSQGLDPQRNRGSVSTNDEPAEKTTTEKNPETENLDVDQTWLPPNLPIMGYPVVLGFDPWMFGGYPNWGLLGRKKREDDGINSEEDVSSQPDATDVNVDGGTGPDENGNRTVDGDDFEEWASAMSSPPGFSMLPWDVWMAWNFDNAMWDVMRLLHELNSQNSSEASNDTDTNDPQPSRSEQVPVSEANADSQDEGRVEDSNNRTKRSSDGNATDDEVKEAEESVNTTKDHDKRYAQVPGRKNGFPWPFFPNRGPPLPPPQYLPVFARYWPVVIPPPNDYRTWPNIGNIGSFPNLWANPLFPQYPWSNGNGQFNLWDNTFRLNRFTREADGDNAKPSDEDSEREQRSQEEESSRRESSQGNVNSAGDNGDSVWRSASRKYASKDNWEQPGNTAAGDRYDYTSSGSGNQDGTTQARPAQPGWLKNMLSGTGDSWKNAQSQQYRNLWDPAYAQPYGGNVLKQDMWSNAAPGLLPSTFMTPGSAWPNWEGSFDDSMFLNHDGINTFGGMDPRAGYPFWADQWQDSFGGSPRNWFSLRDTSSNSNYLNNLMKLWYGRFSRDAKLNETAESQFNDKDEVEKEELRQKREALSEEQIREKRWESVFGGTESPFSSFQELPSWGTWCKVYWNVVRHKRSTAETDDANNDIMKRSSVPKGSKEKRWNEWNGNQQGANWMSTVLDLVCPLVLPPRVGDDWQDDIADSSPDVASPYLQLRNKREAEAENSLPRDSTAGQSQAARLGRWWNPYSDDYDCLDWISSVSAWSPWKGWNLLRASRENAAVRTDSHEKHAGDTQVRSYESKDNRAVRCREWYRKYRESNRKSRGENSKDDSDVGVEDVRNQHIDDAGQDYMHDAGKNTDSSDSQVRHRREIPDSDRLKRQGQMNFRPSLGSPYSSSQSWNRHPYPYSQYYQNPMSWLGPDMYSSFGYDSRRNSPFEFARGLRHSDDVAEGADPTSQQRQKRSNEDVDRSKRFWSPAVLGFDWTDRSRWYDNGNQWGWPMNSYNRPPMYSTFTDDRNAQSTFPIHDWIRQQRNVGNDDQSGEGKHNTENGSVGRKKRESMWTGFQQGNPWFGDFRQQTNPGFWNDHSWMLKRQRRDTSVGTDEGRDKRFAGWGNLIPNTWNELMQQSFGPFGNAWAAYPHNQFNNWRYTRDVDSKTTQGVNQIKERAVVGNSKTKRQLSSPALSSVPQGLNWGRSSGYGNIVPLYYNYWGGFPGMYFNRPEELWGGTRFARESDDDDKVDDSDKTSQTEEVSRAKRWGNANYNSRAFNNDWNSGSGFLFGSGIYGTFNPNPWEGANKWNTRDLYRRSGEQKDSSRSRRSTGDSNKEKRWFGHQGESQAPTLPGWQEPIPNAAQSYASSYQNPLMATQRGFPNPAQSYASSYQNPLMAPQQGFDWQRSNAYPWSESWNLPQRGPYSRNEDFPLPIQFWGSSGDSYRFPRKSNDQGESRSKRDTQNDGQMKRWSGYQNPMVSHSNPQSGFGWQQSNTYPWSQSWNPFQRGSYGRNEGFPTQSWGSSWDSQRYPRKSNDQGESRSKRNTQSDGQTKRWSDGQSYTSGYLNPLTSHSNPQSGFGWQQGNTYPWSQSWNPFQRGSYGRNEGFPTQSWGNSGDSYRFPRKSNDQGEIRSKRDTRNDSQMKRWSGYQNPLASHSNPQRGFGWQQGNTNPWSESWNPFQRGPYGRNEGFPTQSWGNSWDFQRYPRHSKEQGDGRMKRDTRQDTRMKRWQPWSNSRWPLNNVLDPYTSRSLGNNEWVMGENGRADNFWNPARYPREARQETKEPSIQDGKVSKRWFMNEQYQWPINGQYQLPMNEQYPWPMNGQYQRPMNEQYPWPMNGQYQRPMNDRLYPYSFLNSQWGGGKWDNLRYPRKALKDNGKIKKRSIEAWNFNSPWQRGGSEPWTFDPHGSRYFHSNNWQDSSRNPPTPFGFQGLGEWTAKLYIREAEGEKGQERTRRDTETKKIEKRWEGSYRNPVTNSLNWDWSQYNTGYDSSGFYGAPTLNWNREYASNSNRFQRSSRENTAPDRHKREAKQEARDKRWQGSHLFPSWLDRRQNVDGHRSFYGPQNRYDSGNNWGGVLAGRRQPGWDNVWNQARYRRSLDKLEATKSKRWQQNANPWSAGYGQSAWNPQGQMNPWNRGWGGSSGFGTESWRPGGGFQWNSPGEASLGRGFGGYRNMWRFPRQTGDSADDNNGNRQKRETADSNREKRENYWDNVYGNSWGSRAGFPTFANPWTPNNNWWNSNWNSRRYRRSADGISDGAKDNVDAGERNKRQNFWDNVYGNSWSRGTGFPTFTNPRMSGNNLWDGNWISGRFRRSTDSISENNQDKVDSIGRNKRQNYWDNLYRNSWASGTGFPTAFANAGISRFNMWDNNWNSRRYRRSADSINGDNKESADSEIRNKRQNFWDNGYGNSWSSGTGFPTFVNPWTPNTNWWGNNWNSRRYRRSVDASSDDNKENVDSGDRNKRENFWDNGYGNSWSSGTGFPTFANPWTPNNNWWNSNWNSRRYRRSADGISDDNKENVDAGDRNKREDFWDNGYGNSWSSGGSLPTTFANPWISGNNLWDRNWNSHRYRRSTDSVDEDNKETVDANTRNKRQNYWDNVYRSSWSSGNGFPSSFANPWTWKNNWREADSNFHRYPRSADGITEENKETIDSDVRNKRQNYWDNVSRNGWSSGGRFPATFGNPWTASNNWWDSNWIPRRYRRSADEAGEQSPEAAGSGARNKRQNYWDNVFGPNRNKNWLSPNWPLGGTYPNEIIFVLSPFVGSWPPSFGRNGLWNRNGNQPAERYFRDTTNAQERTNSEDGDTSRNKRSLNFDFARRNDWNTNDYFNPTGDNSYSFPQRNFWNPYYGTNNRFPGSGQRFYRKTGDENGSVGKERLKRGADDRSRVKRFGNPFWNYNYPPMYYANSWGQDPIFNTNNWFSPVSPWYMAPRMAQFRNPWYNPYFFGVLRNLRQIKDADVNETIQREKREGVSKEPRQAQWFDFYNNPFGYESFQRDNPFWGQSFGLRNPASRGQNLYTPWKSFSSWDSGTAPTSFPWVRDLRETDNENNDQKRSKRDAWGSHVDQNVFGSGRSYGSNWNNPGYGGVDPINSWSSEQKQFWNTNRPGMFGQQWRHSPTFQWGQRLSGYSPVHSKRDSENTQGATQNNGGIPNGKPRTKRGVEDVIAQRNKRWWSGSGVLKPQDRTWTERQMGFDHSNPWYPDAGNDFWSDRTRGAQLRGKRDASVEDLLKNKRWVPFGSQRDAFSRYGWRNPGTNQWRSPSWYSGQGGQDFNQQNPGYPLSGTYGNQGSSFWNGAALYRKRRSPGLLWGTTMGRS